MYRKKTFHIFLLVCFFAGGSAFPDDKGTISPMAEEPLRRMCDFLSSLNSFSLHTENSMEVVLNTGQKLILHRSGDAKVRRPDKVRADMEGDRARQQFYYDGKSITLYGLNTGFYATEPAPPEIDAAMDFALEEFNLTAPMVELMFNSPYERLIEGVKSGFLIGESKINGVECLHLAFREKDLDWQIWIEKDPARPFPRKVVITDNLVEGSPQFTGVIGDWKVNPSLPDDLFVFKPPENAHKIEFLKKKDRDEKK